MMLWVVCVVCTQVTNVCGIANRTAGSLRVHNNTDTGDAQVLCTVSLPKVAWSPEMHRVLTNFPVSTVEVQALITELDPKVPNAPFTQRPVT